MAEAPKPIIRLERITTAALLEALRRLQPSEDRAVVESDQLCLKVSDAQHVGTTPEQLS